MVLITGCNSSSDVLATYKDGKLTRGELEDWLKVRKMTTERVYKTKRNQKGKIRKIVLDRLVVKEGEKNGFYKNPMFTKMMGLYAFSFSSKYFRKKNQETATFKEDAVKLSVIKLRANAYKVVNKKREKKSKVELDKEIASKIAQAKSIIAELNGGKDFSSLAMKYSTDFSKKKGGDWGYLTRRMRHPVIMNAAFNLKKGDVTKEPIVLRNSIYIIKASDRVVLTPGNIESVIGDKNKAKSLQRRLSNQSVRQAQSIMMNAKDVKKPFFKSKFADPKELLFSVGAKSFYLKDLNAINEFLDKFNGSTNTNKDPKYLLRRKKSITRVMFLGYLTERIIKAKKWDQTDEYKKELASFQNSIKANIYTGFKFRDIKVTEAEMKKEYTRLKDRAFTRKKRVGKRVVKTVIPYYQAKTRLQRQLLGRKRGQARSGWHRMLLKTNNFKVNEKELLGK